MLDQQEYKEMFYVKNKANQLWALIASILDEEETSLGAGVNIMLTINARYLNGVRGLDIPEFKEILKMEWLRLIEEKLG